MTDIFLKPGNTAPILIATLTDANGAIDLTGATVNLVIYEDDAETEFLNTPVTVTDAPNGQVQYEWQLADVSTIGRYYYHFLVTFVSGKIAAVPNNEYENLLIIQ